MKKLFLIFLLYPAVCNASPMPFLFPSFSAQQHYEAADFKAIEHSIFTNTTFAHFSLTFNKDPLFGSGHSFDIMVGTYDTKFSFVLGWEKWLGDGVHTSADPLHGSWAYKLEGVSVDFTIPLGVLGVGDEFDYRISVGDSLHNDSHLSLGYTNNSYDAAVPEPTGLILLGLGLIGLAGWVRRKKK